MKNIFNSIKLMITVHDKKSLVRNVADTNGRGIPQDVLWKEGKTKLVQDLVQGTLLGLHIFTVLEMAVLKAVPSRWLL